MQQQRAIDTYAFNNIASGKTQQQQQHAFTIYNPEKTLTFAAATAEEKSEWIGMLCSTINKVREQKPLSESGMSLAYEH
jgi:uncharacterized protein (UPF0276 family)